MGEAEKRRGPHKIAIKAGMFMKTKGRKNWNEGYPAMSLISDKLFYLTGDVCEKQAVTSIIAKYQILSVSLSPKDLPNFVCRLAK